MKTTVVGDLSFYVPKKVFKVIYIKCDHFVGAKKNKRQTDRQTDMVRPGQRLKIHNIVMLE